MKISVKPYLFSVLYLTSFLIPKHIMIIITIRSIYYPRRSCLGYYAHTHFGFLMLVLQEQSKEAKPKVQEVIKAPTSVIPQIRSDVGPCFPLALSDIVPHGILTVKYLSG